MKQWIKNLSLEEALEVIERLDHVIDTAQTRHWKSPRKNYMPQAIALGTDLLLDEKKFMSRKEYQECVEYANYYKKEKANQRSLHHE